MEMINDQQDLEQEHLNQELQSIKEQISSLASKHQGNTWMLLLLLREIEAIHRQIREDLFEPSLPDTRQNLYKFLKEIDEIGGWPYIERMKLQAICSKLKENPETPEFS